MPDSLKNTFVERGTQYTSFSSRKRPANAGSERKQFTENASLALQQTVLTHAHTKCPPVPCNINLQWRIIWLILGMRKTARKAARFYGVTELVGQMSCHL